MIICNIIVIPRRKPRFPNAGDKKRKRKRSQRKKENDNRLEERRRAHEPRVWQLSFKSFVEVLKREVSGLKTQKLCCFLFLERDSRNEVESFRMAGP